MIANMQASLLNIGLPAVVPSAGMDGQTSGATQARFDMLLLELSKAASENGTAKKTAIGLPASVQKALESLLQMYKEAAPEQAKAIQNDLTLRETLVLAVSQNEGLSEKDTDILRDVFGELVSQVQEVGSARAKASLFPLTNHALEVPGLNPGPQGGNPVEVSPTLSGRINLQSANEIENQHEVLNPQWAGPRELNSAGFNGLAGIRPGVMDDVAGTQTPVSDSETSGRKQVPQAAAMNVFRLSDEGIRGTRNVEAPIIREPLGRPVVIVSSRTQSIEDGLNGRTSPLAGDILNEQAGRTQESSAKPVQDGSRSETSARSAAVAGSVETDGAFGELNVRPSDKPAGASTGARFDQANGRDLPANQGQAQQVGADVHVGLSQVTPGVQTMLGSNRNEVQVRNEVQNVPRADAPELSRTALDMPRRTTAGAPEMPEVTILSDKPGPQIRPGSVINMNSAGQIFESGSEMGNAVAGGKNPLETQQASDNGRTALQPEVKGNLNIQESLGNLKAESAAAGAAGQTQSNGVVDQSETVGRAEVQSQSNVQRSRFGLESKAEFETVRENANFHQTRGNEPAFGLNAEPKLDLSFAGNFSADQSAGQPQLKETVFQQLAAKLQDVDGTTNHLRLNLKPQSLGDIDVALVVENGKMTARIVASSVEVRDVLAANLSEFKANLENRGLQVQNISLAVRSEANGQQGQPDPRNLFWFQQPAGETAAVFKNVGNTWQNMTGALQQQTRFNALA